MNGNEKLKVAEVWQPGLRASLYAWLQEKHVSRGGRHWIFPGVMTLINLLRSWLRPRGLVMTRTTAGFRLLLSGKDDVITPEILACGSHEQFETDLIRRELRHGMTFIDIGANVGYFSLAASREVGSRGKVYAFEPEPANYELLCKNIALNEASNIKALQKAVSNSTGKATLYTDASNFGAHTLSGGNIQTKKSGEVTVDSVTLDEFISEQRTTVQFIKIDAQGAEGMIFEKGERALAQESLKILMEFWPRGLRTLGADPLDLLKKLSKDFQIFVADKRWDFDAPMAPGEILKIASKETYINLFCRKKPS